jgi:hypothetical protein
MAKGPTLIASAAGAGAATVTFSSIPQTYTDLKLVWTARSNRTNADRRFWWYINGTQGGTYYTRGTTANNGTNGAALQDNNGSGGNWLNGLTVNSDTGSMFSHGEMSIPNYTSSVQKIMWAESAAGKLGTAFMVCASGNVTGPVTSFTFSTSNYSIMSGSTFYLYGIKNT